MDRWKPNLILKMENHLTKHILPRFGRLLLDANDETAVQEFVADLKRTAFEKRKRMVNCSKNTN